MASQDGRLSKFEADFKQQESEMTNKIDIVLKTIIDRIMGVLPSDSVKNLKLNVNSTSPVLSARSYPTGDSQCSSHPPNSINAIKTCSKETNLSQNDQLQEVTEIGTQRPKEPEQTLEDEFKDLHLNYCLELGKNGSAFIQGEMPKRMEDPGLFLLPCRLGNSKPFDTLADLGSCVNIIQLYLYKKLKIRLLEETDHVFGLLEGTKSYPVRIVRDVEVHIGKLKLLNDFYVIDMKKDPETPLLEIARDAEINPFKDVLVFRRMVEFLGALPINLKGNMWESKDLIENPINWEKPPKNRDGEWHAKIRIIDPDGEVFTKTFQLIPTSRKLSEKENPREIINLDHFHDT
ncbi:DNA-directed DNA polymerase [Tanacetum coccineum]